MVDPVEWSLALDLVILGLDPGIFGFPACDLLEELFDAIIKQYKTSKRLKKKLLR